MPLGLPCTIVINENEQMVQIQQRVTSLTTLIEFQDYFKYFAGRAQGVSTVINNLYEKFFAHPGYLPMLETSTNFVQFLNEMKRQMHTADEVNAIACVERKHCERFWKSRQNAVSFGGESGNLYFFRIQIDRVKGLTSAFEIAFDAVPLARFPENVCIYRSKQELVNIGNCIEIGEPDQLRKSVASIQQQMDNMYIPNAYRPWYISVNEANVEAYAEVLSYIISKAYLGKRNG